MAGGGRAGLRFWLNSSNFRVGYQDMVQIQRWPLNLPLSNNNHQININIYHLRRPAQRPPNTTRLSVFSFLDRSSRWRAAKVANTIKCRERSAPIASYPPSFILGHQRQTELDAESPSIFLSTDCGLTQHNQRRLDTVSPLVRTHTLRYFRCRLGLYVHVTSIHWVVRERVADAGTSSVNEFTEVVFPTSSSRESHLDIARTKLWPVAMFPGYRLESYISQVALVFLLDFGHTPTIRNMSFWRGGGYQRAGALALLLTRFLVIYLAFFVMTEQLFVHSLLKFILTQRPRAFCAHLQKFCGLKERANPGRRLFAYEAHETLRKPQLGIPKGEAHLWNNIWAANGLHGSDGNLGSTSQTGNP
ncbi:hypothetical protein B0H11DRAFT_2182433 [Mycena galericulata]|nr:hypothetical protein B0H11DRAFT_2182433 [Mycena galericulata]